MDNVSIYLTPNISLDPTVSLAGSQAQQFNAGVQQQGTTNQQAFGIEYQVPYAIRYDTPTVITDRANNIGVPDVVGTGTGAGTGSNVIQGPPGPPGLPGPAGTATPGGNDKDVQFNNSGTTDGSDNFTWDNSGQILDIEGKIQSTNNFEIDVLGDGKTFTVQTTAPTPGSTGDINIQTNTAHTTGASTETSGSINISTGFGFGDAGGINITTGNSLNGNGGTIFIQSAGSTNSSPGDIDIFSAGALVTTGVTFAGIATSDFSSGQDTGPMNIRTGDADTTFASGALTINTGAPGSTFGSPTFGGDLQIITNSASSGGIDRAGAILIGANNNHPSNSYADLSLVAQDGTGTAILRARDTIVIMPNTSNGGGGTATTLHLIRGGSASGGNGLGNGAIFIGNADVAPTGTPASGGLLYSTGGALHWRGSSGTDTPIAPA